MNELSQADLKRLLNYDDKTGVFTWIEKRKPRVNAGDIAGSISKDGYTRIKINGKYYLGHRLAWFFVHGVWPENELDHENHRRSDNWITNLRCATGQENHRNKKLYENNASGICGVVWHKATKKWLAQIRVSKKQIHLGLFDDKEKAIAKRQMADLLYGYHANHGR